MKTVTVFYTAESGGEPGEAALDIEMQDETAENLIKYHEQPGAYMVAECYVENLIALAEKLRGRRYIQGSIKALKHKEATKT